MDVFASLLGGLVGIGAVMLAFDLGLTALRKGAGHGVDESGEW